MEDSRIVDLYWRRDETALAETQNRYGGYCYAIAYGILCNREDAQEIVNDTYKAAWDAMPPHHPEMLSAFLGKITRRLSLKRLREKNAGKRGSGETAVTLNELEECIPDRRSVDAAMDARELTDLLNAFLETLPTEERRVFLCRYWYFDSIRDIASRFGFGQSKVKMMLKRTREKLRVRLEKEGIRI